MLQSSDAALRRIRIVNCNKHYIVTYRYTHHGAVLQSSDAAKRGDNDMVGHLQSQLKKAHSQRMERGTGPQTEAEKQRMALGGLVTEVEVLSLTNAQLVLDLHRLRQVLSILAILTQWQ